MKKLIILSFVSFGLFAQQAVLVSPSCVLNNQSLTANGNTSVIDNRPNTASTRQTPGCSIFSVEYTAPSTVTALTITLQGAADNNGTPGSYSTLGTISYGSNPSTTTGYGSFMVTNAYAPWVRVNLSGYTGSGTVRIVVQGSQAVTSTGNSGGGGGGTTGDVNIVEVGGVTVPSAGVSGVLPVAGSQATGVTRTAKPVTAGMDDTAGKVRALNSAADDYSLQVMIGGQTSPTSLTDGQSNTQKKLGEANNGANYLGVVTFPLVYNGTTLDKAFVCTASAVINLASGTTEIIPLSGTTVIRICTVDFVAASPVDVTFKYGTGTNCGTGTTSLTGTMAQITTFSDNFQGALRTAAGKAFCITLGGSVSTQGVMTYGYFN